MKSSQGPLIIYDWMLNLSRDGFGLHQEINVRVTMEFEVPIRHILRPTLPTNMVQRVFAVGEAKEVL